MSVEIVAPYPDNIPSQCEGCPVIEACVDTAKQRLQTSVVEHESKNNDADIHAPEWPADTVISGLHSLYERQSDRRFVDRFPTESEFLQWAVDQPDLIQGLLEDTETDRQDMVDIDKQGVLRHTNNLRETYVRYLNNITELLVDSCPNGVQGEKVGLWRREVIRECGSLSAKAAMDSQKRL